jgi:hypothetical protein
MAIDRSTNGALEIIVSLCVNINSLTKIASSCKLVTFGEDALILLMLKSSNLSECEQLLSAESLQLSLQELSSLAEWL